ncbi:MAG: RNA polymerase sigma factor, partial [Ktedonobacterales bacterium]
STMWTHAPAATRASLFAARGSLATRHPAADDRGADDRGADDRAAGGAGDRAPVLAPFETFFAEHQSDVFGYLWRHTGDEQAAYDLSQETFLRAWQRFDIISRYEQPRAWLFRVATNLAINHQRHRSTHPLSEPLAGADAGTFADPAVHFAQRDALRDALLTVPGRQRAALILRVVYGLSFDEMATILSVSHANAKMLLSRGRDRFRACYLQGEASQ